MADDYHTCDSIGQIAVFTTIYAW